MKFENNQQIKTWVKDGKLIMPSTDRDIIANFNIKLPDVDIDAMNIISGDILSGDIISGNINSGHIISGNINSWDIKSGNIDAGDIKAMNINSGDIKFYASAIAYESFTCKSVKGRRKNALAKCLDGEIVYKKPRDRETGKRS